MNSSAELDAVASRVVWFESPDEALRYPRRFLAYLMTLGTVDEILITKKYFTDADFQAALDDPPPGIFDLYSWHYWNRVYGRIPVPPLPVRRIPG